ncbi:MAG: LysR substrate-binding domain-containing protein [Bdellovibrionota bacterium]
MAVHKVGHFAKAAKQCQVTQPTLSMQIQKLEADLGVVLFDRSKKPILITQAGQALVEQMHKVLREAQKIESIIVSQTSAVPAGTLVIGVIPTIAPYLLHRFLPILKKRYPAIAITIRELQTHQIVETLQSDETDVGILATPLKIQQIFEIPLYYEPFSVLCGSGHEYAKLKYASYEKMKLDDLWLLEEGHCLRHQMLDVCAARAKRTIPHGQFKFESGSLETLKNIVSTCGGFTLMPSLAADRLDPSTRMVEFERPIPARQVGLVYRREHHKANLIELLGDVILESIPEKVRKLRQRDLDVLAVN